MPSALSTRARSFKLDPEATRAHPCGMNPIAPIPQPRPVPDVVAFQRNELARILRLYGMMVAAGEWRDYAISHGPDQASFSIFRRSAETPLYRVEKHPALRLRQGQYCITGSNGQVLRRGHDLENVLRFLESKLIRAVD